MDSKHVFIHFVDNDGHLSKCSLVYQSINWALSRVKNFLPEPWNTWGELFWFPILTLWQFTRCIFAFTVLTSPAMFWVSVILSWYLIWKLSVHIRQDIFEFYALGKGGTPSNVWGWWRIKRLEFFGKIPDVLAAPAPDPYLEPYRGILRDLPKRAGSRPRVKGCAPQRQIDQRQPPQNFNKVMQILEDLAKEFPAELSTGVSFLEGATKALFAKKTPQTVGPGVNSLKRQFGFEIAHPHRIDGSLHVNLHPEDVGKVIEAGWGERHPISNTYWYWLLYFNHIRGMFDFLRDKPSRPPVPETLVFIYAPRDDAEREVVKRIVGAAAWWITEQDLLGLDAEDDGKAVV